MKKIMIYIFLLLMIFPINTLALSKDYTDVISKYTKTKIEDNKVNLYLFHGQECPHCEEEREWLKEIEKKYQEQLNIYYFEVWHNDKNVKIMEDVSKELSIDKKGVPLTIVGKEYYVGYSKAIGSRIESKIKEYVEIDDDNQITIPILGQVNIKDVSIPLVAIILGFIDGFNPCAMWILLFLINLLFGMDNKKRAWILGITFLLISGLVYFLSMIGINFVLGIATIKWMKLLIATFILIAGILNFRKYLKTRKEAAGCTVVDSNKRKRIVTKMKSIIKTKSFGISLIGIIVLAASVNLIEMACSLGFPVVFNELLTVNSVFGINKIIYLLIYIFFYMIDDMVVFAISMITLEATGITNKYNKLCTLISAIIMIIMGLLLIIKPDWLMFNF